VRVGVLPIRTVGCIGPGDVPVRGTLVGEGQWAQAVLDAARDGHPAAYGKARLQAARSTLIDQIEHLAEHPDHPKEEGQASPIPDPLVALRELDQAIKQAVEEPALRRVEPARSTPPGALPPAGARHLPATPGLPAGPPTRPLDRRRTVELAAYR
jgi:hypothetical protein